MRQKADKLEKGKWYRDTKYDYIEPQYFKFECIENNEEVFSEQKGNDPYPFDNDGKFRRDIGGGWFIPTPEDIEKYNLN